MQTKVRYLLCWEFLKIENDNLHLDGFVSFEGAEFDDLQIYVQINNKIMAKCEIYSREAIRRDYTGGYIAVPYNFRLKICDISNCEVLKLSVFVKLGTVASKLTSGVPGIFFPVGNTFKEAYAMIDGWMTRFKDNDLFLFKNGRSLQNRQEEKFLQELEALDTPKAREAILYRNMYQLVKPMLQREIWLVSDRANRAGDNGEAFFKYLNREKCPVDAYYIINKDSNDFRRLSKNGRVLAHMSSQHKLMHILADKIISSQADPFFDNPFLDDLDYYRDILYEKKQIYLRHGIGQNNLSSFLGRHNKNFNIFITSVIKEYDSIVHGRYEYDDKIVKLTGMPRYDEWIAGDEENLITIMPTWRLYLADPSTFNFQTGFYGYDESFKQSRFFLFYNALLNNKRLLASAQKHGYKIKFMPHPLLLSTLKFFDKNPHVDFASIDTKHSEIFKTSKLLITDYSSTAFDFAYMRKPVVYCQFDYDEFYKNHTFDKNGDFFDYAKDGFGEVTFDMEKTIDCVIDYMENGCQLKEIYRKRIDDFFQYNDHNNCKRVYEAITGTNLTP